MRKYLLLAAALLICVSLHAQERKNGIGIRVGDGVEVSYVRNLATHGYITASAGMLGFDSGFFVTATYNQILRKWRWTPRTGDWFIAAGGGGTAGMYRDDFNIGIAADVAFGIKFKQPITLAVDYRPTVLLVDHHTRGLYNFGVSCYYNF